MSDIVTVYAVFGSDAEAQSIAETVVTEGLAACANILAPCRSIYRWQGKVDRADEVPALFKTAADRAETLIARIAELHSYEVPAVVAWPIEAAHPPYAEWVRGEAKDS